MRDCSNGLISLISNSSNETTEPFDANRFTVLMDEIATEVEERAREGMAVDYTFPGGPGTATNPLDLTSVWLN